MEMIAQMYSSPPQMCVKGAFSENFATILTPDALQFLTELHLKFNPRRRALLNLRLERQKRIDAGELPDFLPETAPIRAANWTVAPIPADLQDRRVEITGPVERKMVINALNSGAKVFMADFEDSNTPSWDNNIGGQINLRDAINGTIAYENPQTHKIYRLNETVATLMVRPRGWHLEEKGIQVLGENMSGSLVDFGLFIFHNIKSLISKGSAPYFYLPKLESHLEARLWNDVFVFSQTYLGVPQGLIKATVLIETILAAFETDEILYELREHSAGLNCGRWDYIFSYVKKFRNLKGFVLPDRSKVTMTTPFLSAYCHLVVKNCHRRGVHAMGGMAAQIPIKNNLIENEAAMARVQADKFREVTIGYDGTWVAHPGLVPIALNVFNENMATPNQITKQLSDYQCVANDLLAVPSGTITEAGLRQNINVGILYLESWLRGNGAAAIHHLMEDAATAEISRTQVWQWLQNAATMEDGRTIDLKLYEDLKSDELKNIEQYVGKLAYQQGRFVEAIALFDELVCSANYIDFLTLSAYELLN
ncbi:MAG: malate synthase [Bacteroidota bacterium]|jgi:malate synthase